MTPPKQPVSVLVVIYTAALDVLLLERAAHPGFWQSVTGSREGDEILIDTARREVLEETGIDTASGVLSDWRITNTFEIFSEWRHRYAPGITHNDEHDEADQARCHEAFGQLYHLGTARLDARSQHEWECEGRPKGGNGADDVEEDHDLHAVSLPRSACVPGGYRDR